jgi:hypothetical protein
MAIVASRTSAAQSEVLTAVCQWNSVEEGVNIPGVIQNDTKAVCCDRIGCRSPQRIYAAILRRSFEWIDRLVGTAAAIGAAGKEVLRDVLKGKPMATDVTEPGDYIVS